MASIMEKQNIEIMAFDKEKTGKIIKINFNNNDEKGILISTWRRKIFNPFI